MTEGDPRGIGRLRRTSCLLLVTALFASCQQGSMTTRQPADIGNQRVFALKAITPIEAASFVSELELGVVRTVPDQNAVWVAGSPADLKETALVLDLVDTRDRFVIVPLVSAQEARILPSNKQIAKALGEIVIGTFANPPMSGTMARGVIDIHHDTVIAIVPVRFRRDLLAISGLGLEAFAELHGAEESLAQAATQASQAQVEESPATSRTEVDSPLRVTESGSADIAQPTSVEPQQATPEADVSSKDISTPVQEPEAAPADVEDTQPEQSPVVVETDLYSEAATSSPSQPDANSEQTASEYSQPEAAVDETTNMYARVSVPNGEETLELDLPQTMDLTNLLDLAAEYLDLDYLYEPTQISGQAITLRLHGQLQGTIRVKDWTFAF